MSGKGAANPVIFTIRTAILNAPASNTSAERPRLIARLWRRAVTGGLVFNQSLDDPELDRQALGIGPAHTCVVSTSGGCNALSLLCEEPKRLIAVDPNAAHNHLAELKRAAIYSCTPNEVFELFGRPRPRRAASLYRNRLRHVLPPATRRYWDGRVSMLEKGIVTQGSAGVAFRLLRHVLWLRIGRRDLYALLSQPDLEAQRRFYHDRIAKRLWAPSLLWTIRAARYCAPGGRKRDEDEQDRPDASLDAAPWGRRSSPPGESRAEDACGRLRRAVETVVGGALLSGNYFVVQALAGRYLDRRCVPPYLLAENLEKLPRLLKRLELVTARAVKFLEELPAGSVDRLSLILGPEMRSARGRWTAHAALVHAAAPGARIVLRAAPGGSDLCGWPLRSDVALGRELHARERFPLYGGFCVLVHEAADARTAAASRSSRLVAGAAR